VVGLAVASSAVACNALTGVGDLALGEDGCGDTCDDAAADRRTGPGTDGAGEDGSTELDASVAPDATTDASADAPIDTGTDTGTRPSYCTGITMYLAFDDSLATKDGQTTDPAVTNPSFVTGKYGKAIDMSGSVSFLYYASSFSGASRYAVGQGTVAMWLKGSWAPPCAGRTFFKPHAAKGASSTSAGAQVSCGSTYGLSEFVVFADGGFASTGPNFAGNSSWTTNNWNHLLGTWDQASPRMTLSVNGQARATTTDPWTPGENPANWLKLGSETTKPDAIFDEVVIWNRALGVTESSAVYNATQSIGQVCGL
jgi:Concanavalin A-like lectin/glucanases superfamily